MIITMILSNHIKNITKSLKHLFIPPVTYRGFFIFVFRKYFKQPLFTIIILLFHLTIPYH
ncbi:hypothetical protein BSI_17770 [Bacillus inaquosorum KCTC 13429]|uniref:Uncharacterized protein n=1 Tax=Bacillus inaquosorum KCTC 13429 TaxID=1236548 RepID=A0A9W5LIP5_9BACI|nr:hypothetical protein BSI_17770 [Bacillus inaquosorum KCTC 13429]